MEGISNLKRAKNMSGPEPKATCPVDVPALPAAGEVAGALLITLHGRSEDYPRRIATVDRCSCFGPADWLPFLPNPLTVWHTVFNRMGSQDSTNHGTKVIRFFMSEMADSGSAAALVILHCAAWSKTKRGWIFFFFVVMGQHRFPYTATCVQDGVEPWFSWVRCFGGLQKKSLPKTTTWTTCRKVAV